MLVLLLWSSFYGLYFSSDYTCYKLPSGPLRAASIYTLKISLKMYLSIILLQNMVIIFTLQYCSHHGRLCLICSMANKHLLTKIQNLEKY